MRRWFFTLLLACCGLLAGLLVLLFHGGGHGWGTDFSVVILPVMLIGVWFDQMWFAVMGWKRETGLYIPILFGWIILGSVLQFSCIGYLIDRGRRRYVD